MNNLLQRRLASLLCVKSIVTLVMAAVFAFSVLTERISGKDFLTVFSVIIAFYFGTQSERLNGMLGKTWTADHAQPARKTESGSALWRTRFPVCV